MAERSLGAITPGAAAVPVTTVDPTWAHSYTVRHWSAQNAGGCYIGDSTIDDVSGDGVTGILRKIDPSLPEPEYRSPTVEKELFPYNMANVYLSAESENDSFLVTFQEP